MGAPELTAATFSSDLDRVTDCFDKCTDRLLPLKEAAEVAEAGEILR